ncbi:putative DNA-binding protein ESCAROLA [Platanthera zijinensis]|uniref:DNA-binding protein ESCAROLA n=1 Tax=Platanthera zijinensis TaxID=2320716 RepID=A0AAP0BMD2_9ASPA
MDPVSTWQRTFLHRDLRLPFHPILHAPAPHLPPYPLLRRSKSESDELSPGNNAEDENQNSTPSKFVPTSQLVVKQATSTAEERPRGLPARSKNQPKSPIMIFQDSANCMLQSHMLEISDGCDVADSLASFAARNQRGICILSGGGAVADVTIRQPESDLAVLNLHGRFEILSMSGSFLPQRSAGANVGVTVYLAGGHGQVVGGSIVGVLTAYGTVTVMVVSFGNAAHERLPLEEEDAATAMESPAKRLVMPEIAGALPLVSLPSCLINNAQLQGGEYRWAAGGGFGGGIPF